MGNYRWDGGSKRKFFDDSLPTDSAVSFLLALYTKKNRRTVCLNCPFQYTLIIHYFSFDFRLSCIVWLLI